ncbi:MAG: proC1 [Firmicutes bacterium]|nr:proC1 [Bacillota bacterium]
MEKNRMLFIGAGNMSEAIIQGILNCKLAEKEDILVNNRTPHKMTRLGKVYGIGVCHQLQEGLGQADTVVLGVKPQDMDAVLDSVSRWAAAGAVIVSIAAGKSIGYIEERLGAGRKIVRVMPNTLVDARRGFSALCSNSNVSEEELGNVMALFSGIGDTVRIKEQLFDAFTGFSCSGPAYIYEFLEAMIDAGVYAGISRADSASFALQNMIGACEMVLKRSEHPAILKERMTSPGGVTISGLKVLNECGFKGIVQNAVAAAVKRSEEI